MRYGKKEGKQDYVGPDNRFFIFGSIFESALYLGH